MSTRKLFFILLGICLMSLFPPMQVFAQYGLYSNIYGLNGLYRIGNPYSFGGLYYALNPTPAEYVVVDPALAGVSRTGAVVLPAAPVTLPTAAVLPPPVPVVIVTTNWIGSWYVLNTSASVGPQTGTLTLQLIQNTTTGALDGLVDFGATNVVPVPVSVTGILLPGATTFSLDGIYFDPLAGQPANINLVCTLTSNTTMSGTFNIISWEGINIGSFYLTLL
ncbi:MAG: hypothetical protein ACMUJM_23705 [bacterium]